MIRPLQTIFKNTFPALYHANFRYYWMGMSVSLIGTWMQNVAQAWLVFTLTGSPFMLGLVGTLQFTPMLLFSLFAGAAIDKLPKRSILLFTQCLSMILALTLSLLVWTGYIRYWHVLVLAVVLGCVNTIDMPTRQSFIIELAGRQELMNAIALNSSVFNMARIIGPGIAGLLMAYTGIAFCFVANGISFIPIIIALLCIKVTHQKKESSVGVKSILKEVGEGLKYITGNRVISRTIIMVSVMGIFAMNMGVLVPVFAKNILGQGETGYGFLMSSMGIGSFTGAILLASMSKKGPREGVLFFSALSISVMLVLTGLTNAYYITAAFLVFAGMSNTVFFTTANTTMQYNAKDEFRGRVTSAYTLVFNGFIPIGNFVTGTITEKYGPRAGFAVCGITIFVFIIIFLLLKYKNRSTVSYNSTNC